jgi:hypothetical protein
MQNSVKLVFHKNVLAPVEDLPGTEIVDLGTGSGSFDPLSKKLKGEVPGPLKLQTSSLMQRCVEWIWLRFNPHLYL